MNKTAQRLAKFNIPPEVLEAAGVWYATDAAVRELLGIHGRPGQDLSGIVFPYRNPHNGQVISHRVRLDVACDRQKYLSEKGCRALFFAPVKEEELADTSIPTVIVEAEKSALAMSALACRHARKLLVIATGGVWGWKRKAGTELQPDGTRQPVTGPSPSLDCVTWKRRTAMIMFDSNVAGRRDLEQARLALARELTERGAQVFIATVPRRRGVNGPDDLIAVAGDTAALEMLDRAAPFVQAKPKPTSQPQPGFTLMHLGELLARPDIPVDYVWESRLVAGTVSMVVSKPKVGKSTFARNLTLTVARGANLLGLGTKRGECIYLALEEREEDVRHDFRALGADGSGVWRLRSAHEVGRIWSKGMTIMKLNWDSRGIMPDIGFDWRIGD